VRPRPTNFVGLRRFAWSGARNGGGYPVAVEAERDPVAQLHRCDGRRVRLVRTEDNQVAGVPYDVVHESQQMSVSLVVAGPGDDLDELGDGR